jgi:hypothetical protein
MAKDLKEKSKGNGHGTEKDNEELEALKQWKSKREKETVPHAYTVLFNNDEENKLDEITRLNPREIMFMAVNGVRDDGMIPRNKRLSISTCLRVRIKRLKISQEGKGRDDVLTVSQLSQEDAMAQQGSAIGDR